MKIEEIEELKETLAFATIHKNIIEPKTADQLQKYINQIEADKLEMAKAIEYITSKVDMHKRSNAKPNQVIDFIDVEVNKFWREK